MLGTSTVASYAFSWTNVAAGTYSLTAKAYDNLNAVTTSAAVAIAVQAAAAGNLYFMHPDHLDTPRQVSDATGKVVWQWEEQEPFGLIAPLEDPDADGKAFVLNLRFSGQYFDAESRLHHNVRRDYDPVTGRYVQADPIGLDGGISLYGYVGGNPLGFVDPLGLCAKNIGPNAKAGRDWEQNVDSLARGKYGSANVESQVLVRPLDANGKPVTYRVRLDNTISQPGQPLRLIDAKASESAGFTRNQGRDGYSLLANNGGRIESGPMKGTLIPKTEVQIVRPRTIEEL